jgi:hypothetical protein
MQIIRVIAVVASVVCSACSPEATAPVGDGGSVATASLTPPPPPPPPKWTKVVGVLGGVISEGWQVDWSGFSKSATGLLCSYGFGRFALEMPLEEGDRMLSLIFSANGNNVADLQVDSLSAAPDWSQTRGDGGTLSVPNAPDKNPNDYEIDLVDTIVKGGISYWFEFESSAAGLCVGAVRLTYDRPDA